MQYFRETKNLQKKGGESLVMKITNNNEKGITLIALIITVIILVILAAVSIRAVYNMGIVGHAVNGSQDYAKAAKGENNMMQRIMGVIDLGTGKIFTETKTLNGDEGTSWNPTIPKGFKPVNTQGASWNDGENGGPSKASVNNGLIIEDADGNQFVWVPVDGTDIKYEKHVYDTEIIDDGNDTNRKDTGNGEWTTAGYRKYEDWEDNGIGNYEMTIDDRVASVEKYGGFYVARFEAGVPSTANFYASKEGDTYYISTRKNADAVLEMKPTSKYGEQVWNSISQEKAKVVSYNMYADNDYITSCLIDGYAWDTIVSWIVKDTEYAGIQNDSTEYGNYNFFGSNKKSNGLYAVHRFGVPGGWTIALKYRKGEIDLGVVYPDDELTRSEYEFTNYSDTSTYRIHKEIATGTLEVAKIKNIYDMAGNMWEWTTETGKHDGNGDIYAVKRGGSFDSDTTNLANVSVRSGGTKSTVTEVNYSFRVVLYL